MAVLVLAIEDNQVRLATCNRSVLVWQVRHGEMWWDVPAEASRAIQWQQKEGRATAIYQYEWGRTRPNNVPVNGVPSTSSVYVIDFDTMKQRNTVSGRIRSVRCLWLHAAEGPKSYFDGCD